MYLYRITNIINNKKYIGITNNYKRRWAAHKSGNGGQVISAAINKYGKDNFHFELIKRNLSIEEASEFEREYIKNENTLVPNGYNVAKGGYGIEYINRFGENNPKSALTNKEAQYIKDNRNIPEYVLYEEFSDKISYESFKKCYLGKTYTNLTTNTEIYPFNLEFSNQFTSNNKLEYDEVVELRKMYAEGIHWETAFEKYKNLFSNKWSFWNAYVGNSYKLVMPEVFTKENKHLHHSLSSSGEKNGRAKLTREDVIKIRELNSNNIPFCEICKIYNNVSNTSIRNVINYKTWKNV